MRRRHFGAGLALVAAALVSLLGAAPAGAQFGFLEKWGSSGSLDGQFESPLGVGTDSAGNVYVGDGGPNDRIQKFTSSGGFLDKWGSSGTAEGQFNEPHAVDTDAAGNVFGSDAIQNRIQSFDSAGGFQVMWGWDVQIGGGHVCTSNCTAGSSAGTNDGQFNRVRGVATDPAGNVYTVETNNARVQKFTSTGSFLGKWGSSGTAEGEFDGPRGLDTDAAGNVYVADTDNHRIQKFDSSGGFLRMWGYGVDDGSDVLQACTSGCQKGSSGAGDGQLDSPHDVATDATGNLYVTDGGNDRIQKFTSGGSFLLKFGSGGAGDGQFASLRSLATDCRGNVYVADAGNDRIQKLGDPASGDPPCPSPAPPGTDPAPTLDASAKGKQRAKKLKVKATCDVDCTLELSGKAKLPTSGTKKSGASAKATTKKFNVKPRSVELQAGVTETIRVKFENNRKSVKKITRLLKSHKRAKKNSKVIVKLTASNDTGSSPTSKVKFKLKR